MRTIIIGDVHGCLDELDELMRKLELRQADKVIMVGDLIDRGPDPAGCVRRVRESGWDCVLGNHENRAMLWLRNESMRLGVGRPNNMRPPFSERQKEWESLSGEDLAWLWKLPLKASVGKWLVSHAGVEPCSTVTDQDTDQLMHIRWVDKDGRHMLSDPSKVDRRPDDSFFWAEVWKGPESIIYGHSVFDKVRRDEPAPGVVCLGIDTGCVYGGDLTALVLQDEGSDPEFVQVRASREYFSYTRRAE